MHSAQYELHAQIEQRHWWFVARRQIVRRLIAEIAPPAKDTTILDVGCGTGGNIAALAGDYRCLGLDASSEAVALAAARFPNVRFVCGQSPAELGAEMQQARVVLLMDVLEHVADDVAMLRQWVNSATSGTHFLLTVPADPSLWSQHDESFGHFRRYVLPQFWLLWKELPVETLLVSHVNARLYPLIKFARSLSRLRGRAGGESGTDFRIPNRWLNGMLEWIFAGESRHLIDALHGRRAPLARGVSLLAVLRKVVS